MRINLWTAAKDIVPANTRTSLEEIAQRVNAFIQQNNLLPKQAQQLRERTQERYDFQQKLIQKGIEIFKYKDYFISEEQLKLSIQEVVVCCLDNQKPLSFEVDFSGWSDEGKQDLTSISFVTQPDDVWNGSSLAVLPPAYRVAVMRDFRKPEHRLGNSELGTLITHQLGEKIIHTLECSSEGSSTCLKMSSYLKEMCRR
jgi:hypothetical protein